MKDNFEKIKPLLSFKSEDEFYFVQIIQRKKDTKMAVGSNNSNRLIKAYYISSIEQLDFLKEEMIFFAKHFNARVGINLNKRSFERTAFHTMKKISDQIMNRDYRSVRAAYNSVCGEYSKDNDKRWILDIDEKLDFEVMNSLLNQLLEVDPVGVKVIAVLDSRSGYHLITKPFNIGQIKDVLDFYKIEVHKNNPTNLYIP